MQLAVETKTCEKNSSCSKVSISVYETSIFTSEASISPSKWFNINSSIYISIAYIPLIYGQHISYTCCFLYTCLRLLISSFINNLTILVNSY